MVHTVKTVPFQIVNFLKIPIFNFFLGISCEQTATGFKCLECQSTDQEEVQHRIDNEMTPTTFSSGDPRLVDYWVNPQGSCTKSCNTGDGTYVEQPAGTHCKVCGVDSCLKCDSTTTPEVRCNKCSLDKFLKTEPTEDKCVYQEFCTPRMYWIMD